MLSCFTPYINTSIILLKGVDGMDGNNFIVEVLYLRYCSPMAPPHGPRRPDPEFLPSSAITYLLLACNSTIVLSSKNAIHSRHKLKTTPPLGPQGQPPGSDPKFFSLGKDHGVMPSFAVLGLLDRRIRREPICALYILIQ